MHYADLFQDSGEKVFVIFSTGCLVLSLLVTWSLTLEAPKLKIVEFDNSADPDEAAHNELPHLDLLCFLPSLGILSIIYNTVNPLYNSHICSQIF